jgi:hypothetical protein
MICTCLHINICKPYKYIRINTIFFQLNWMHSKLYEFWLKKFYSYQTNKKRERERERERERKRLKYEYLKRIKTKNSLIVFYSLKKNNIRENEIEYKKLWIINPSY